MKKLHRLLTWALACLFLSLVLPANPGCASKPKPDWNQRVGHFTFDEAVFELGPPVASTMLEDGATVAEWFLKPGPQISFGFGSGFAGPTGAVGVGQSVALPTKGHFLRLIFGPDGQLQHWEHFRR